MILFSDLFSPKYPTKKEAAKVKGVIAGAMTLSESSSWVKTSVTLGVDVLNGKVEKLLNKKIWDLEWEILKLQNLQQTSGPRFPAAFRRGKVGIIRKLWKAEKATSGDPFATCLDVSSLSFWQGHSIVAIDIPKNSMEFWKKFKKPNERQGFICRSLGKQSMSRLLIWLIHKMPNLKCVPFITMPSQEKLHHWIVPHYFNSTAIWPTLHPTRHHFHRAPNGLLLQISPGFHQQPSATAVV